MWCAPSVHRPRAGMAGRARASQVWLVLNQIDPGGALFSLFDTTVGSPLFDAVFFNGGGSRRLRLLSPGGFGGDAPDNHPILAGGSLLHLVLTVDHGTGLRTLYANGAVVSTLQAPASPAYSASAQVCACAPPRCPQELP